MDKEKTIKQSAQKKLSQAVKSGEIKREPCEICKYPKADAHHDDYTKPLEIRHLCRQCHGDAHVINESDRTDRQRTAILRELIYELDLYEEYTYNSEHRLF